MNSSSSLSSATLALRIARLCPWAALLAVGLTLSACSAETDASSQASGIRQRNFTFVDANPAVPLPPIAHSKLQEAMRILDRTAHSSVAPPKAKELALHTLERLESGDVILGSIAGARGIDRWHMCKDYALAACTGSPPAPNDRTWYGDDNLSVQLEEKLDGYQWGNRVYLAIVEGTVASELASTLVHEVAHVLNRSECRYYKDVSAHRVDDNAAFVEEFRSFFAECIFVSAEMDLSRCSAQALESTDSYGFHHSLDAILPSEPTAEGLAKRMLAETAPFGRLVPAKANFPSHFVGCNAR
jgi:hypothetical protein